MNAKLNLSLVILLGAVFAAITVALFIPSFPLLPVFSLYLVVVFSIHALGRAPVAFMMTGFTTLLGIFCMMEVTQNEIVGIPVMILVLWAGEILIHFHTERIGNRTQRQLDKQNEMSKESRIIKKEIEFYEKRTLELSTNAERRHQLSQAARDLGALLDPASIQDKLLETARSLFPNHPTTISYGQNPDAVDRYVIQKRQPLIVPSDYQKGDPLIAAPVMAQKAVAGIVRVGGAGKKEKFTRDDLRVLDILSSMASQALDNSFLFNQVQEMALRDGLTGLLTHRAFQEKLANGILEASRYNQPLSIILMDVDHFKSINDRYGHQSGDGVLQGMAHIMVRNVRDVDYVARYGGEEFVIILLQTTHEDAITIAESIRADIEAQPFDANGKEVNVTGSFGVSTFPEEAASEPQLVRLADERLYAAKKAGRNQVIGKAA